MTNNFDAQSSEIIVRNFELADANHQAFTEQELFDLLADRIAYMIEHQLEMLLSLMYRLDIDERKINLALSPQRGDINPEPANIALAHLVMERQKERIATKKQYKQQNTDNWLWEE